MQISSSNVQKNIKDFDNKHTYHCGTLTYGKAGLAMLFAFLLWGDFCFTLMEAVVPSILPLKFKELGAPNWLIGICLTTVPGAMSMVMGPWVSFKSDRFRSRWGRRIPFIVLTMPFLCIFLALLGWSDNLAGMLRQWSPALREYAPATVTIGLIALFLAMFKFFDCFVNSVFWYLFNDVVPPQFLGRFMGAFRIVGIAAGALYNWFIFKYAESNMREIFIGVAVLYFIGFGIMCLCVREGQYPTVEGTAGGESKGWGGLKTFFKESFSHKFYWFRFAYAAFSTIAGSILVFNIFFQREMGLSLDQVGKMTAITSIVVMAAIVFMASFVDRWHPLRLTVYAAVFGLIGTLVSGVWLFVTLPGDCFFWISLGGGVAGILLSAIVTVAGLPCDMRLFPKSRFGQFCSAAGLARHVCNLAAGISAGLFIDVMKWFCHGSDFAYRFSFAWTFVFSAIGVFFLILVYREWLRLGGDSHFHPPASWSPTGVEEMPITSTIGPQSKWLKVSFLFFDSVMLLSVLSTPVMMWWMQTRHTFFAFKWYGLLVLPFSILSWCCWIVLKKSISTDIAAARTGKPLRNGIPHHGVLMLVGSQYLLLLGIWIAEVVVSISMNMETGAIAFGITRVITNFMLIGAIWLLCRIERGYSTRINTFLSISADNMEMMPANSSTETILIMK
ncbi:MAG: MFS transporter [Victivallaceae bacterium]|jgi:MFS family permease